MLLGIVGGALQSRSTHLLTVQPESKAGLLVFLASWAGTILLLGLVARNTSRDGVRERRLLYAVAFNAPFILVRLVYSILGAFRSGGWSIATGSVTRFLVVAVLEEIVVVLVFLGMAIVLKKGKEVVDLGNHGDVEGRGSAGAGKTSRV